MPCALLAWVPALLAPNLAEGLAPVALMLSPSLSPSLSRWLVLSCSQRRLRRLPVLAQSLAQREDEIEQARVILSDPLNRRACRNCLLLFLHFRERDSEIFFEIPTMVHRLLEKFITAAKFPLCFFVVCVLCFKTEWPHCRWWCLVSEKHFPSLFAPWVTCLVRFSSPSSQKSKILHSRVTAGCPPRR